MSDLQSLERDSLEEILSSDTFHVIFKHSYRCSISSVALNRFEKALNEMSALASVHIVDVIGQRDLSMQIADETSVRHESPQVLVLKGGAVLYHASHFGISNDSILDSLNR